MLKKIELLYCKSFVDKQRVAEQREPFIYQNVNYNRRINKIYTNLMFSNKSSSYS